MIKWIKSLFRKPVPSPEDNLWRAMEEFNAAWKAYEVAFLADKASGKRVWTDRIQPWMDWSNRRVVMSVTNFREIERKERSL